MSNNLLMNLFGRPQGLRGRLGGHLMVLTNRKAAVWIVERLAIQPDDKVLEVGFGPGVAIRLLAASASEVAGVDPSPVMVEQAKARNRQGVGRGQVVLRQGIAENLPFEDGHFDKALSINSLQVWTDAMAGLREIRRVLKPGGTAVLGFTPYSGQPNQGFLEMLAMADFTEARVEESELGFYALAVKP